MSHDSVGLPGAGPTAALSKTGRPAVGASDVTASETVGTVERSQPPSAGSPTRAYTPGTPARAHGLAPHDVTPTSRNSPSRCTMSGPPESPPQVSVAPPPAQSIVDAPKLDPQALAQAPSPTSGTPASSSVDDRAPLSVTPQPTIVAAAPGLHSARSAALVPIIASGSCGAARARCSSARSERGAPLPSYCGWRTTRSTPLACPPLVRRRLPTRSA